MSRMPTAQEIVALKTTAEEEARWDYLDYRRNTGQITREEQDELKENLLAQHLMIIAKANAMGQLQNA